jgi:hypothetical protein
MEKVLLTAVTITDRMAANWSAPGERRYGAGVITDCVNAQAP